MLAAEQRATAAAARGAAAQQTRARPPMPHRVRQSRQPDAESVVRKVLSDALPAGAPPSFRRIVETRRLMSPNRVIAVLEMFDGLDAEVEVWQASSIIWAHRWNSMRGGDISYENGKWVRIAE